MRLALICLLIFLAPSWADELQGKVVGISGGDAITVLSEDGMQHRIKLLGIAAPELSDALGKRSFQRLSDVLYGSAVSVDVRGKDGFQRLLGKVALNGRDVALKQIEAGLGSHVVSELQTEGERRAYAESQDVAQREKVGIWRAKVFTQPVRSMEEAPLNCREIRNTLQCDDGAVFTSIGSRVYGNDGEVYRRRGGTVYGPDGSTYRQMNGTTYGSDGSICRQRGTRVTCY